jgi:hypothetical protein
MKKSQLERWLFLCPIKKGCVLSGRNRRRRQNRHRCDRRLNDRHHRQSDCRHRHRH